MTTHTEKRNMPYSAEQLFALVADVERYPEFLPWCIECQIDKRRSNDELLYADLTIGYKMLREKFGSKVTLEKPNLVHVEYISGPMKHLSNHWKFIQEDDGSCTVDFYVDFEFKNRVLQNIIGVFFTEAMHKMVRAFEGRARELYGSSSINK